ncbi:MAG TPA: catecholate siderophore receptor Fiu [Burkholderiaceae bacterium]|jgi:catecholate siderophore receptor
MSMIKSRKHHAVAAIAASLSAPLWAQTQTAAQAQATDQVLPTIKVTADKDVPYKVDASANPKLTAPLLDTPQSIQIIPEQVLREQAATTLAEALRNSAGVSTFFLGENGSTNTGDAIYMRGFDASSSIFVDGIRDIASISRDTFNIEQVEVVKGPSGSDVGRSSPTGYINLVTKKPTMDDSFSGSLGFGSASFKRASIDLNRALSAPGGSGTAFRLNAVVQDNGVVGRDVVKNKRWAVAPSLAFGLGTETRVYVDLLHVDQDNIPDGGVPTIGLPGYTSPDTVAPIRTVLNTAAKVDPSNFYGTTGDFDRVHADMFTVRVEHELGNGLTLRNTTRYGRTAENSLITSWTATQAGLVTPNQNDPTTWTLARNNANNKDQVNTILSNQLNVTGKIKSGSIENSMSAGLELSREEQQNWLYYGINAVVFNVPGTTSSGSYPAANLYAPNANVSGYQRLRTGASTDGATTTAGAYLFDTLSFNDQWMLSGGLRVDHYRTSYFGTALVTATTATATAGTLTPTSLAISDSLVTGKIGLVYKPLANGSVYVDYATGAQPPGGSNFALATGGTGNSANRTDFDPQKTKTYELGTKWDLLDKNLSLSGALYRTEVSNGVVQDPVSLLYFQSGKQRVQGVEVGAVGQLTKRWGVSAGFTTMNTSIVSGPAITSDGSNVLSYTPRNSFTFWTSYDVGSGFLVGFGGLHNAALHRGTDGAVGTPKQVDAYTVFNAMGSYKINRNFDVQLNVSNLFDKDYVAAINKSGYRYTPGAPRSYKLTANMLF